MIEIYGAGPEDDHSQCLVGPGEITPYDIEINLGEKSAYSQQGKGESETFAGFLLVDVEPVGKGEAGSAESSVAGGDGACNDAQHGKYRTYAGAHVAYADFIHCAAGAACFQYSLQSAGAVKEGDAGCSPDEADNAFSHHGAIEYRTAEPFILQAAGHNRRLGGMETGNSAAGNGDEHQRPDRQLVLAGVQVGKNHFRHDMAAYAHEHATGNAEGHDNEADAEEGIETGNDFIHRKKGGQEIVEENDKEPGEYLPAGKFGKEHGRAGHEYGSDQNQKDDGEETHNGEHGMTHMAAYDFGNTVAVFPDGHHAGEIVMDAAGKNGAQHDPEIYGGAPESAAQSTEDGAQACNVQELDEENLPGRKGHIVYAVIMNERRRFSVGRSEELIHNSAVNKITGYEGSQSK